jgi:hypothetical protein
VTYALFFDDVREPPNDGRDWVVARSFKEAVDLIDERGWPNFISFDHDMGYGALSGMEFAKWIVSGDLYEVHRIPDGFTFDVHSANPVGAENIRSLMSQYLERRAENNFRFGEALLSTSSRNWP